MKIIQGPVPGANDDVENGLMALWHLVPHVSDPGNIGVNAVWPVFLRPKVDEHPISGLKNAAALGNGLVVGVRAVGVDRYDGAVGGFQTLLGESAANELRDLELGGYTPCVPPW